RKQLLPPGCFAVPRSPQPYSGASVGPQDFSSVPAARRARMPAMTRLGLPLPQDSDRAGPDRLLVSFWPAAAEAGPQKEGSRLPDDRQTLAGCLYAAAAYIFWGLSPLYFKMVVSVPPEQILAHRIVWSLILLLLLVTIGRRW